MSHAQRRRACQIIGEQPLRFSAVLGLKNTREAAVFRDKNQLYFYLTRYLIERVSWFCKDYRSIVREGDGKARIIFSRRGGLSYNGFQEYLRKLKNSESTTINWSAIDIETVKAEDHSKLAGLQIADCGISAIASAIEPDRYGNVEGQYLNELRKTIFNKRGNYLSYGLKFLPGMQRANLTAEQAANFSRYE